MNDKHHYFILLKDVNGDAYVNSTLCFCHATAHASQDARCIALMHNVELLKQHKGYDIPDLGVPVTQKHWEKRCGIKKDHQDLC